MPKVKLIEHTGVEHVVDAMAGSTLLQVATDHVVPGLDADCGGNLTCGTCQCYVEADWLPLLPPQSEEEKAVLEMAMHVQDNSRLSCQLVVTEALDGLTVRLPKSQI